MTDSYYDQINRHESYIARLASYLRNTYSYESLAESYQVARKVLVDAGDIKSQSQLTALLKEIDKEVNAVTASYMSGMTSELNVFAGNESTFYSNMLGTFFKVKMNQPEDDSIIKYINKSLMSLDVNDPTQTGTWAKYVKINRDSITREFNEQIKKGYREQETISQITKRLRTVTNGVLKNQAESLVRTGTHHYAIQSRRAMINDNLDVIGTEKPLITYDNRVTVICMSISARYPKGWPVNKSPIGYPGYHFGCRTIIVYLPKGVTEIDGTRAAVGARKGTEAKENFERRKKRLDNKRNDPENTDPVKSQVRRVGNKDKAFIGQEVSNSTPFAKFLETQEDWYVRDTLKTQANFDLFKAGKLDLSTLTDKKLKPLTVKEVFERN